MLRYQAGVFYFMSEQISQPQSPTAAPPIFSDEPEILDREKQIEKVNGKEEIKNMSGAKAGGIATRLSAEIWFFVRANKLGRVYGPDTMFTIGKNDRMPDVSFVAKEKIPKRGEPLSKWKFAPDLAIEVISPNDIYDKIFDKLNEYFSAGVKQVWLVEPRFERVRIYNSPDESKTFHKTDELTCEEILPDFKLKLNDIFID